MFPSSRFPAMPTLYPRGSTERREAMIRLLICLSLLFWSGTALAEISAELVAERAAAESAVMIPPAHLACGQAKRVKPNDQDGSAQGNAEIPLRDGESYHARMAECCAKALSVCTEELAKNIQTVTQQAECSGCVCPTCGAKSCQPTFTFPKDLWSGGNIEHGYCTAYGDEHKVTCWRNCWVKSRYWEGAFGLSSPSITIGCSKCETGHVPVKTPADPLSKSSETLSAW